MVTYRRTGDPGPLSCEQAGVGFSRVAVYGVMPGFEFRSWCKVKKARLAISVITAFYMSIVAAQEPGPRIGFNGGFADSGGTAGVNLGYGFTDIVGLDIEYAHKFGDQSGELMSAFLTLTTTGETYFKGKIGATAASGNAFDGSSGSLGIGLGHKLADGWVIEVDVNQYASDVTGGNLLFRRSF